MTNGNMLPQSNHEKEYPEVHYEDVVEVLSGFNIFPEILEDYQDELRQASPENFDTMLHAIKEKVADLTSRYPDVYFNQETSPYGRFSMETLSLPSFSSAWREISSEDRQEVLDGASSVYRAIYGDDNLVELLYPVGEMRSVEEYLEWIDYVAAKGNDPDLTTQGYSNTR